jgi:hypothetical protein
MYNEMYLLEWWYLVSQKICDGYVHSQEDDYNEVKNDFLT